MATMGWLLGILLIVVSYESTQAAFQCIDSKNVCLDKKLKNPGTPSGTYLVGTVFGNIIEVYCDMKTDGGGYTYINPTFLARLASEELAMMFTNKTSFRLCYRKSDGTQYCAILKQLLQYGSIPLKLGLSENDGYRDPVNRNILGNPYLYFGFLPITDASNTNIQGMRVNGISVVFKNCDANPNSQITLFPNFPGTTPSNYLIGSEWPLCNQLLSNSLIQPDDNLIPDYFFSFGEIHFGGCGCYCQTNRMPKVDGIAIGFR